jgi:murein DD-endopeptidase MepM/ murein hydrolase activator NlpD
MFTTTKELYLKQIRDLLVALVLLLPLSAFGQGFMMSPLVCGDPGCGFIYSQGVYTPKIMNSVLDHSMIQNGAGFWQYGTTSTGGGNGAVIAFNGETANGAAKPGDVTCRTGVILLKPTPGSPAATAMVNASGCNGGGAYVYSSYDEHPGYDYRASTGTPVYAVASGTVLNIGGERCYKSNISGTCNAWGYVGILHPNGYISQYGHLSNISVAAGAAITQGQQIGLSGNTAPVGIGAHLHFEVLKQVGGVYYVVDPYGWVGVGNDPLYSRIPVPPQKLWL